jgi:hypothetical protein
LARASGRRYYRKGAEKADTGTSTSRSGQSMRNSKERLLDMMEAIQHIEKYAIQDLFDDC